MALISMAKAAKMFAVSRPTLSEHLKSGKISGKKIGESWQIDTSELLRVYGYRGVTTPTPDPTADRDTPANLSANLSAAAPPPDKELQAEIMVLQAELKAAQQMIEEKDKRIDDLRRMLPAPDPRPQDPVPRRRWWRF